jgi:L-ascorbate 6-phosphate lactonase
MSNEENIQKGTTITFLGQAGFLIKSEVLTVLIDPYLTNYVVTGGFGDAKIFHRECEPPFLPEELPLIDCVFITHEHADHCDLLTLAVVLKRNPECVVICSEPVLRQLQKIQLSKIKTLVPSIGKAYHVESLEFFAIPAAHYGLDRNPDNGAYYYLGYVLNLNKITIYHSGDTVLYPGLVDLLRQTGLQFNVVCLPVNGKDEKRESMGIVGNLDVYEALFLANELHAKVMIPMHNDMFKINQSDPAEIKKAILENSTDLRTIRMFPGDQYTI